MFDLSHSIDLPLTWAVIMGLAVFMYVFLDGFDLGVGILFPFAPSDDCRSRMMNSIAPFWDGNETWLVLGGAGLLIVFPLAYSIILPAMYFPILFMLIALIFRGVAFEIRFKAELKFRKYWDYAFHFGSLIATFSQGLILGGFVQGIKVEGRHFTGGPFDWLTAFSVTIGFAMIAGYILLGATWLILKTDGKTQEWAKKCALYSIIYVVFFMALISIWLPFMRHDIMMKWFSWPNIIKLIWVPFFVIIVITLLIRSIIKGRELMPFIMALMLFVLGYIGLCIGIFPFAVPYEITIWEASSAPETQSLNLAATIIMLPMILWYTFYSYFVFRGKIGHEPLY